MRKQSGPPEEQARQIVALLKRGNYTKQAAEAAGCAYESVRMWIRDGNAAREHIPPEKWTTYQATCAAFASEVQSALGVGEALLVGAIGKVAATGEWRAAAWLLERRFPKRWGARINVTVDEELAAFMARLESRLDRDTFERVLVAAVEDDGAGSGEAQPDQTGELN